MTSINVGGTGRPASGFGRVTVGGPPVGEINAQSKTKIRTLKLTSSAQSGRASVHGGSLAIYAPKVNAATAKQGRPKSVSRNLGQANLNLGESPSRPLAQNSVSHTAVKTPENETVTQHSEAPAANVDRTEKPSTTEEHSTQAEPEFTGDRHNSGEEHTETAPRSTEPGQGSNGMNEHHEQSAPKSPEHTQAPPQEHTQSRPAAASAPHSAPQGGGGNHSSGGNNQNQNH